MNNTSIGHSSVLSSTRSTFRSCTSNASLPTSIAARRTKLTLTTISTSWVICNVRLARVSNRWYSASKVHLMTLQRLWWAEWEQSYRIKLKLSLSGILLHLHRFVLRSSTLRTCPFWLRRHLMSQKRRFRIWELSLWLWVLGKDPV